MNNDFYHTMPMDFRERATPVILEENDYDDEDLLEQVHFNKSTNPFNILNQNYVHYVHLKNSKKSKSVV